MSRFFQVISFHWYLHQNQACIAFSTSSPWLPHLLWFESSCDISGVHIKNLPIMQFPPIPCYFIRFRRKYLPHHSILQHPQPMLFPKYEGSNWLYLQYLVVFTQVAAGSNELKLVSTHSRHQPAATWVNTTRYCKYS